jgi:hypothetical protein
MAAALAAKIVPLMFRIMTNGVLLMLGQRS